MKVWVVTALWALFCATGLAGEWQKLTGCRLIESNYNDGDSFHVSHGGKEFIFRLAYVDTPETRALKEFTERTTDQAKYFGIKKSVLFEMAAQASGLTKQALGQPFTVWTDWTDAKGNSQIPRAFGIIETSQGDLAELLVKHGLSRVYGYSPARPDGTPSARYKAKLKELEEKAFAEKAGAWAQTKRQSPPKYGSQSNAGGGSSHSNPKTFPQPEPKTSPVKTHYVPAI